MYHKQSNIFDLFFHRSIENTRGHYRFYSCNSKTNTIGLILLKSID